MSVTYGERKTTEGIDGDFDVLDTLNSFQERMQMHVKFPSNLNDPRYIQERTLYWKLREISEDRLPEKPQDLSNFEAKIEEAKKKN